MANLYPRKQTVIIFIVCAMAVIAMVWYSDISLTKKAPTNDNVSDLKDRTIVETATTSISTDWKRQFFGNATSSVKLNAVGTNVTAEEKLTFTDQVARNYFTEYMMAYQAGMTENADMVNNINNRFISKIADSASPIVYSKKDIAIRPDGDRDQLINYGKSLLTIMSKIPKSDPATIANAAFEKEDMELLEDIDPIIKQYESIVSSIKVLPVPQSLSQYHLDLLNGISIMLYTSVSLRNVENDPAQALAGMGIFEVGMQSMSTTFANMQKFFLSQGINFVSKS